MPKVHLAACLHAICQACLVLQADKLKTGPLVPVCPLCENGNIEISHVVDSTDTELAEDVIVKHGLSLSTASWELTLQNRVADINMRYEVYLEKFIRMKTIFIHIPKTAGTSFEKVWPVRNYPMVYTIKPCGILNRYCIHVKTAASMLVWPIGDLESMWMCGGIASNSRFRDTLTTVWCQDTPTGEPAL